MKLSPDELRYLRHWMFDEVHYAQGAGAAKRLQIDHRVRPADLAVLIAAALPSLEEQQSAGNAPPSDPPPCWPWSEAAFRTRLDEARAVLASRAAVASSR